MIEDAQVTGKRPNSDKEGAPPAKKQKTSTEEETAAPETFTGTVVKKLERVCFVKPDEEGKGDVLLRAQSFEPSIFDQAVVTGSRIRYSKLSKNRQGKVRADSAEIIHDGVTIDINLYQQTNLKTREGVRNEDEECFEGVVVKRLRAYCFVKPEDGGKDVMLRADCFKQGEYDEKIQVGVKVQYWDVVHQKKKVRANGAAFVAEGPDGFGVLRKGKINEGDEVHTGMVVKKLDRICFVKPDNEEEEDVLVRADAFEDGTFDALLTLNHRVRYWAVSKIGGKVRADGAEIFVGDDLGKSNVEEVQPEN